MFLIDNCVQQAMEQNRKKMEKEKQRNIELSTQFSQFSSRCVNIYVHTNEKEEREKKNLKIYMELTWVASSTRNCR